MEEIEVPDQTQRARKRLIQDASAKGKKVSKKVDRVSDMTMALKEYTAMTREGFSSKRSKSSSTFEQFSQSIVGGNPCSLRKAIEMLNQYKDLGNKTYVKILKALQ